MPPRLRRVELVTLLFASVLLAQPVALEHGKPVEATIASGEVRHFLLDLPANQMVRMFFQQTLPFEVSVKLLAPDGRTVAERSSRQNLLFSSLTSAGGVYSIQVTAPRTAAGSGQYIINHIEIRDSDPGDGALLKADRDYTEFRRRAAPRGEDPAGRLDDAAALYARYNQPDFEGWSLLAGGQYWVRLSDYKAAAGRYARSADAFRKAGNHFGLAHALDFLGDISAVLRDYPKAIEASSEALALSRNEPRLQDVEAGSLNVLGRVYSRLGEKQRALDLFQQAYTAANAMGDRQRKAAALVNLATLHTSLGNYGKGLGSYQEALQIQRERGSKLDEGAALSNIASTYASMGDVRKAAEYFQQAIALFRMTEGGRSALATTLSDGGQAYLKAGAPAKAQPLLEEALGIAREKKDSWAEAYALMNLGRVHHATGDLAGAAAILADSLAILREVGDPQVEGVTRFEIARLERSRGNLEASREQAEQAIELAEGLRNKVAAPDLRSSLVASVREYYELDVDVLMKLHRVEEAREAAERGRARNLLDVLANAGVNASVASDPREPKLRKILNDLSSRRTALLRAKAPAAPLAALDKQIDTAWLDYQSARGGLGQSKVDAALGLDTLRQEVLDADSAVLEYSLGLERSYLWTVSDTAIEGFELPNRARIEQAAREFWDALRGGEDEGAVGRAAVRLSQMVLGPARSMLGSKRLVVVADGALQYVPFAALADPRRAAYRPLLLDHEIVHEPSSSILALLRRGNALRKPADRELAVFADPVFERNDPRLLPAAATPGPQPAFLTRAADLALGRLPATRAEGRAIAALAPEKDRWLAMDFDASREAVMSERLSGYRIIHFATHGVIESARPELSALAFSLFDTQGKPRDGFLRLYEIYNLKLQADLVVLSACQTALGKDVRGEGLVGLARGFMSAGAPRVVASLWKVDDQATAELMRLFYAAMLGPERKPAGAALRSAQISMAKQDRWRSPYYWAAFELQGEWR